MRTCFLVLVLFTLFLAGCNSDPMAVDKNQAQGLSADKSLGPVALTQPLLSQEYLMSRFMVSEQVEYEEFEWLYEPGTAAFGSAGITSWGMPGKRESWIRLHLPANALPDDYGSVIIKISVPLYDPNIPPEYLPPMVVKFEPDGLQFLEPIGIQLSYPFWLEDFDKSESYKVYCLEPTYSTDKVLDSVRITDFRQIREKDNNADHANSVAFEVNHFSVWCVERDANHDDGGNTINPPVPEVEYNMDDPLGDP